MGVNVCLTTKYHDGIEDEDMEYAWGVTKSVYRKFPLREEKGKEGFHELVHKCISSDNVSTLKMYDVSQCMQATI